MNEELGSRSRAAVLQAKIQKISHWQGFPLYKSKFTTNRLVSILGTRESCFEFPSIISMTSPRAPQHFQEPFPISKQPRRATQARLADGAPRDLAMQPTTGRGRSRKKGVAW